MLTYPTGKIYIGKDSVGSYRYFGSPDIAVINEDFKRLPDTLKKDYTVRKRILWESMECTEAELARLKILFVKERGDPLMRGVCFAK